VDPTKELTTEEMRKLIERNEIVQTNGLRPYNTVNVWAQSPNWSFE
jgi:hypothetical protein